MKKKVTPSRENSVQAVVDYFIDNGVTPFTANQLLHFNWPSLGEYRTLMDEVRDNNWERIWDVAELYIEEGIS